VSGAYGDLAHYKSAYDADPSQFIVLARLVSVLFDVGTVLIVYLLGKHVFGAQIARVATSLACVNPILLRQAQLVNVDSPLTFFLMLSLYLIWLVQETGQKKWYVWSGVCIGLAVSSKYSGAIMLLALVTAHVLRARSIGKALHSGYRENLFSAVIASLLTFLVLNPFAFLNFGEFWHDFSFEESHMTTGHLGLDPNVSTPEFYLLHILPTNIGWAFCLLSFGSMLLMALRRNRPASPMLIFVAAYLGVILTWNMRADRYLMPILPSLVLSGAYGLVELFRGYPDFVKKFRPHHFLQKRIVVGLLFGALSLIVVVPQISNVMAYHKSISGPDTRQIAKEWITSHLKKGAFVASIPVGIEFPDSSYRIFPIPFLTVNADRVAPFYDTRWYEDFDCVVGTDYDYNRYANDPKLYHDFLAYYDSLRLAWSLLFDVHPDEHMSGPTIWLYAPPKRNQRPLFDASLLKKLEVAPESSRVSAFLRDLSIALLLKGKPEKAIQIMREILSVEVTNLEVRKSLIDGLFSLGRDEEALQEIDQWVSLQPNNPQLLGFRGNVLIKLNRLQEAEGSLQKAIRLDSNFEFAYDELLRIYVIWKDKGKALDVLTKHLRIVSANSEKARLIQRDIQTLKNLPQ